MALRDYFNGPSSISDSKGNMQSKLARALRQQFRASLKRLFPAFYEDCKVQLPSGWRAYKCDIEGGLTAFVILCISPKDDRFTVELVWTVDGRFPTASILQTSGDKKKGESIRLSSLWHPQRIDFWWPVGRRRTLEEMANFAPDQSIEEKLVDIEAKVTDAMRKFQEFGIPYFKGISNRLGVSAKCLE